MIISHGWTRMNTDKIRHDPGERFPASMGGHSGVRYPGLREGGVKRLGHSEETVGGVREESGWHVVEDGAQSIGGRCRGEATGWGGQMSAVSFYPTKNLGALGDGGAILTDRDEWQAQAAMLRDYGQSGKYRHEAVGYNSPLGELQTALLRGAHLPRLNGLIRRRPARARGHPARLP